MAYWVVSPNIDRGLGASKLEKWKRFVQNNSAVFMGWSPNRREDGSRGLGVKFSTEVQKGDLILSAYRHNRRWEVLACGRAKYQRPRADLTLPRGFCYGSYRRLEPFVRLSPEPRLSHLSFRGTTPDELRVIPTIVQFKPDSNPADRKLCDALALVVGQGDASAAGHSLEPEDEESLDSLPKKSYEEGRRRFFLHRRLERNRQLVSDAKRYFKNMHGGKLTCEVCKIEFEREYGERGKGFIEAHHRVAIARIKKKTKLTVRDLAMVCGNCHRMLHRPPWVSVEELRRQWKKLRGT